MLLLQCGRGTISHRPTSSSIIGIFLNLVVATYESEMMKVWFETNNSTMKKICIPHPHMFSIIFWIWPNFAQISVGKIKCLIYTFCYVLFVYDIVYIMYVSYLKE